MAEKKKSPNAKHEWIEATTAKYAKMKNLHISSDTRSWKPPHFICRMQFVSNVQCSNDYMIIILNCERIETEGKGAKR